MKLKEFIRIKIAKLGEANTWLVTITETILKNTNKILEKLSTDHSGLFVRLSIIDKSLEKLEDNLKTVDKDFEIRLKDMSNTIKNLQNNLLLIACPLVHVDNVSEIVPIVDEEDVRKAIFDGKLKSYVSGTSEYTTNQDIINWLTTADFTKSVVPADEEVEKPLNPAKEDLRLTKEEIQFVKEHTIIKIEDRNLYVIISSLYAKFGWPVGKMFSYIHEKGREYAYRGDYTLAINGGRVCAKNCRNNVYIYLDVFSQDFITYLFKFYVSSLLEAKQ